MIYVNFVNEILFFLLLNGGVHILFEKHKQDLGLLTRSCFEQAFGT